MPWVCLAQVDRHMFKRVSACRSPAAKFAVNHESLKGTSRASGRWDQGFDFSFKIQENAVREMAQRVRAYSAVVEDLAPIPYTHLGASQPSNREWI